MTVWRISVEDHGGDAHDVIVEGDEEATIADFWDEMKSRGFPRTGLSIGTSPPVDETPLDKSPLQSGMLIGRQNSDVVTGPGWYVVAIAGPDTGTWEVLGSSPITVGRNRSNKLRVDDRSMSGVHFQIGLKEGRAVVQDLNSTNGTMVEGHQITAPQQIADGAYIHAGSTIFGLVRINPNELATDGVKVGSSRPFQQRFREALSPLPKSYQYPQEPTKRSDASKRPLISFAIPIITAFGIAAVTGRWIFLGIIILGPLFYAVDGIRRRKALEREEEEDKRGFEAKLVQMKSDLTRDRGEELRRDRWAATPAGLAALMATVGHVRLWERTSADNDFCQVAIGLHNKASSIEVEGRPDDVALPFDQQWSAVLRHSLTEDGPLAVRGAMDRARALGRSLLADLAFSHSPNDLKIWLLTDGDAGAVWNDARWLPHTYLGESQNRIFATPKARAGGVALLRSIIAERSKFDNSQALALPIHVFVIDCLSLMDPDEVVDLLTEGAAVGVVGITLDALTTPRGAAGELILGEFTDEASFESQSQMRADRVRSFEMKSERFEAQARSMAGRRPTGTRRDEIADTGVIRLVDLIGAPTSPDKADAIVSRWREKSPSTSVKVGGLGELEVSVDLVRDGPHGLVGGTTRSGKTEFLKAFFTSLAVENHPDDLSIVIIDFKGGVDHELSARLPHVVDLSTNLNVDSFVRTVELLEAEMIRRQELMKTVGKSPAPNFDAYHAARAKNPNLEPLPRLLVVIDEFSELLSSDEGRENLGALESVTRVGGGLGVHLMLVTQNFEAQLPSQIAANSGLRICFRVQHPSHSKAVLDSEEAATIPKERIGRAYLRSHGGRAVEFQGARIAGPLPGRQAASETVRAREVPFTTMAEPPREDRIADVPSEDTDMWAVVEVVRAAAAKAGWTGSAIPWPKALPEELSIGTVLARDSNVVWPIGLIDEPGRQRTSIASLAPYGPSLLMVGRANAGMADALRAMVVAGAARRGPDKFQGYVIDLLGQGLLPLGDLDHIGGVAERNESLALRIVRHVGAEVARRKALLSGLGASSVAQLGDQHRAQFSDLVVFVNGAERLLGQSEGDTSPLLWPLFNLVSESVGTGVRLVLAGGPRLAHHRLGTSIDRRLVFACADPQAYGALDVPRKFARMLDAPGRCYDVNLRGLVQAGFVPSEPDVPVGDVVRAVAHRLKEQWHCSPDRFPETLRELPWPLPLGAVANDRPGPEVQAPVALAVDTESGRLRWLDAQEDGPVFVVTGATRSGRSSTLLSSAALMMAQGWKVFGVAPSRRSPLASGRFPGTMVDQSEVGKLGEGSGRLALFVDDIHKWTGNTDDLVEFCQQRDRCLVLAGPVEFFRGRNDLTRNLTVRSALVLNPRSRRDGDFMANSEIDAELLRDERAGRGVLLVSGESFVAQVPNPDAVV